MFMIGCDFYTRFQQIAMMDSCAVEIVERRLQRKDSDAKALYEFLPAAARAGDGTAGRGEVSC
jgi:hypothetical protein